MVKALTIVGLWCLIISCNEETVRRTDFSIEGIDVSRHQGQVDWPSVIADSIDFVFLKATEGADYIDPTYLEHLAALRQYDIDIGAYHYFRPASDPIIQADHFYHTARLQIRDLPPVVDFEQTDNLSERLLNDRLSIFLQRLEYHYGQRPIIYTNYKLFFGYIVGRFDQYPIWIAKYGRQIPDLGQHPWLLWQYGRRGTVSGIKGSVDLNVFAGSEVDFANLLLRRNPL